MHIRFKDDQEKDEILSLLGNNMNEEFTATLQYICHRISSQSQDNRLSEAFKSAALDEMAHILYFSDWITKLGGKPGFTEWKIDKSNDLKKMLEKDIELEKDAITRYSGQLEKLKDYPEIYAIVESVLNDEEDHCDIFSDSLSKV